MRLRPPLRMSVTRRGEKEQRLGEFIGEYLAETNHARPRPGSDDSARRPLGGKPGRQSYRRTRRRNRGCRLLRAPDRGTNRYGHHAAGVDAFRHSRGRLRSTLGPQAATDRGARAARARTGNLLDRRFDAARAHQVRRLRDLYRRLRRDSRIRHHIIRTPVADQRAAARARARSCPMVAMRRWVWRGGIRGREPPSDAGALSRPSRPSGSVASGRLRGALQHRGGLAA